jgi:hypothetical protein
MADLNDLKKQQKNIKAQIKRKEIKMEKMATTLSEDEDDWAPYRNLEAEVFEKTKELEAIKEQIQEAQGAVAKKATPKKVTPEKKELKRIVVNGIMQYPAGYADGSTSNESQALRTAITEVITNNYLQPNFDLTIRIDDGPPEVIFGEDELIITGSPIDFTDIGEALEELLIDTDLSFEEDLDAYDLASELYDAYNK